MTRSVMLFAVAGFLAADCQSASHVVETAIDSVQSAGYRDGTADLTAANGWSQDREVASVQDSSIVITNVAEGGVLDYRPAQPASAGGYQTVVMHLSASVADILLEVEADVEAALVVKDDGIRLNWYGLSGSGWQKLTGVAPTDGPCDVRVELDNRTDAKMVRYAVRQGSGDFVVLVTANDVEWLPSAMPGADRVYSVSFTGDGTLTGVELTQTGTVTVNDERMTAQGITAAQLGDMGANGNPNWENLVLGLKCKDESSIPVVRPVQTSDPNTVTLKLGGVDIDTASGATVKYRVRAYDAEGEKQKSAYVAAATPTAMDLPGAGVRYYQMEVVTTPGK